MISRRAKFPSLLDRFGLRKGAELGVAAGSFSTDILRGSDVERLYSIDMWAGDRGHDDGQYRKAVERLGEFGSRSRIIRSTFEEAEAVVEEELDFVYIDGYAHTGNDEGRTFEKWWAKLKRGGLLGAHDYCEQFPENIAAIDRFLEKHSDEIVGSFVTGGDVFTSWFAWKEIVPAQREMKIESLEIMAPDMFPEGAGIAVVGNGPVSDSCRERIEAADFVVRFNDWNRRPAYSPEKAGERCDLLFTHFDSTPRLSSEGFADPPVVIIAIPFPFHCDRIVEFADRWYPKARLGMLNPYVCRLVCRDVLRLESEGWRHPMPTVGFSFLYQLWRWIERRSISPDRVYVTGFNWHVDKKTRTVGRVPVEGDHLPRNFNHSYLREAKWIAGNLNEPPWEFASGARESLDFVRSFV